MTPLLTGVLAFAIALFLTPVLRAAGYRFDLLDRPNARSSHQRPTPRTGGVAIIIGVAVSTMAAVAAGVFADRSMMVVLVASAIVGLTGLLDDLRGLAPWQKFAGQAIGATLVILAGHATLQSIPLLRGGVISLGLFGFVVAFFWIIGLTNAYNFMDGINGIAGLQAVITAVALCFALRAGGGPPYHFDLIVLAALAGGILGFLPFNFPGGSIFMGDAGSGAISFLLATVILRAQAVPCVIAVALFSLFPFLFDSFVTFLRRLLNREPVLSAHRSHFYQRLNILGWSHARVALLWAGLALLGSALALVSCGRVQALVASAALILALHLAVALLITRAERKRAV